MHTFIRFTAVLLGLVTPLSAWAQDPCPLGFLSCASDPTSYLQGTAVSAMKIAFPGILLTFLIFYGVRLALRSQEEEVITETKQAYLHAAFGAILVAAAAFFADAFTEGPGVNLAPLEGVAFTVVAFIKILLLTLLIANMFYQGVRHIVAQDDALRELARKRLLQGFIGAAIVVLAESMVETFSARDISIASRETLGVANFIVTIFGLMAVVAIIVAGIFLVISVDEQLKDRAKTILRTAIVALAVIVSAYVIVRTFIF